MAKNFVNLQDLTLYKELYDEQVANAIATAEAKSLHTVAISGSTLNFYREEEPVGQATPAYSINLPEADLSNLIEKISGATGGKVASTKADGTIEESSLAVSDIATKAYADAAADAKDSAISSAASAAQNAQNDVDALETLVGEIPSGATATTVVGYAKEMADSKDEAISAANIAGTTAQAQVTALDNSLATVAKSGNASDVSIADASGYFSSENVEGALAELAQASSGGVASKTVYLQDESAGQSDYAKVYKLYQGANTPGSQTDPATLIGTINVPLDKVVQDGHLVTVEDGTDSDGDTVPSGTINGTYVKLTFQNVAIPVYINVQDLVDVYTGGTTAETTVVISASNEITVTINEINGSKLTDASVVKTKLAQSVQNSLDLADSAIQTIAEGSTDGTISVDGTDIAVHGLGSAAYTASSAYATAAQGAKADTALQDEDIDRIGETAIRALFQ